MLQAPRNRMTGLFTRNELLLSIVQGVVIAVCTLILYYYFMHKGSGIDEVRTIVFTTIILSNMFLTFANRSFSQTILHTIRFKNNLAPFVVIISAVFLAGLYYLPPVTNLFELAHISVNAFLICLAVAFAAVMWFEVYKSRVSTKGN